MKNIATKFCVIKYTCKQIFDLQMYLIVVCNGGFSIKILFEISSSADYARMENLNCVLWSYDLKVLHALDMKIRIRLGKVDI